MGVFGCEKMLMKLMQDDTQPQCRQGHGFAVLVGVTNKLNHMKYRGITLDAFNHRSSLQLNSATPHTQAWYKHVPRGRKQRLVLVDAKTGLST